MDRAGNIYVADVGSNTVKQISTTGAITTLVSGVSVRGYVAVDRANDLYFTTTFSGDKPGFLSKVSF